MPTFEQCAYAAGFFDGEGSVVIRGPHGKYPHRSSYSISACIGNDDFRPMQFLQELWGGSLNPGPVRSNGKCNTRWTLTAVLASRFLQDILPFLIVKREQAVLALKLQASKRKVGPWHPLDEAMVTDWKEIKEQVSVLNQRYPGYYDLVPKETQ